MTARGRGLYSQRKRRQNQGTTTPQSTGPGPIRRAGEALAKKTYTTLSPAVKATGRALGKGADAYLKGAGALAKKIEPWTSKLPAPPPRHPRPRRGPGGNVRRK